MAILKLKAYITLLFPIIIFLYTDFYLCAKTHLIYWNPLNIIFRVKPTAVLHVEQRDKVIFVCPKDEYFILWTYNKQIFENCSNPEEEGNAVNILYRCSFKDTYNTSPPPKTTEITEMSLWAPWIPPDSLNQSFHGMSSAVSKSMPYRHPRPSTQRQMLPRRPRSTSTRSESREEGETFTLLINEFAWSTGTPSFHRNRPVYFTAQPKICMEENMRLSIVQGEIPQNKEELKSRKGPILNKLGAVLQNLQDCNNREKCRRDASNDYTSGTSSFAYHLLLSLHILILLS